MELLLQYNCITKNEDIDESNGSLLHVACDIGTEVIVKNLVEKGKLDVNVEDKWKIEPVHVASAKNHINVLKYLQEKGANINCEDVFGNTPLGWAMFCKSEECEAFLKSLNAQYKEFVVPPPSNNVETEEQQQQEEDGKNIEPLEIEHATEKDKKRTFIPVRKSSSLINGSTNPTFDMNEERKAVTSV